MAVRLRLTRVGGKKDPVWRVVVADQRSPRDGRVIETIGHYNAQTEPSTVVIDEARARTWIERGAQPTRAVSKLLRIQQSGQAAVASAPESGGGEPAEAPASAASEPDPSAASDSETEPDASATEGAQE